MTSFYFETALHNEVLLKLLKSCLAIVRTIIFDQLNLKQQ